MGDAAIGAMHVGHVFRPEVLDAAPLVLARIEMVEHHALTQQAGEGLVEGHQAAGRVGSHRALDIAHHAGPEARIEQMQHRMLDAADVLVHRHPVIGAFVDHRRVVARRAVAHVVPGRIDEGVHGVGFAACGLAAGRADTLQEAFVFGQRIAAAVGYQIVWQHHRQLVIRHRDRTAVGAVDDRDRRAPIALARDAPVAQPVLDALAAQAPGGQIGGDRIDGRLVAQPVEGAGIHAHAIRLVFVPGLPVLVGKGVFARARSAASRHDLTDRQAVLAGKGEVAFVVCRHAHDRAVAVAHQHIVADPDFERIAGDRMVDEKPGGDALFFHRGHVGFHHRALARGLDEGGNRLVGGGGKTCQRMLGCHRDEGHPHDRVGTGGKDMQLAVADRLALAVAQGMRKGKANPDRAADPVGLHDLDPLGPAVEIVLDLIEQLVGIVGDLEVIAWDFSLFDHCTGAPAAPVDDLLVGQHRLIDRIPVDGLRLAIGDAALEHAQEQPLVPLVIGRIAGGHLARPVDRQAHRLHLLLHVGDVVPGPGGRRHAVFHRRVLCRQAKGIPAHRHQDVVAVHAQVAIQNVVDRVIAHMTHVQLAGGVGQHRTGVVLALRKARIVFDGAIGVGGRPVLLHRGFDLGGKVTFLHTRGVLRRAPGCAGSWDKSSTPHYPLHRVRHARDARRQRSHHRRRGLASGPSRLAPHQNFNFA